MSTTMVTRRKGALENVGLPGTPTSYVNLNETIYKSSAWLVSIGNETTAATLCPGQSPGAPPAVVCTNLKENPMADYSHLVDRHFKVKNFPAQEKDSFKVYTMKEVRPEEIGAGKDVRPVLFFVEDPRGLVLNTTNYNKIAVALGSADTDEWVGKKVKIWIDWEVSFNGNKGGMKVDVLTDAQVKALKQK